MAQECIVMAQEYILVAQEYIRNIALSPVRCLESFRSSRRNRPNWDLEIFNFRMAPELQISKKVDLLMIHKIFYNVVLAGTLFFCE